MNELFNEWLDELVVVWYCFDILFFCLILNCSNKWLNFYYDIFLDPVNIAFKEGFEDWEGFLDILDVYISNGI